MKKFFVNLIVFFIIVVSLDFMFGIACEYLNSHAKGGDTKSYYYIAKESMDEVLIMGSSRARHHYVPSILADSLDMSVYNCGTDGNGIIFMYARLLMITARYTPQMIIYDLNPDFDFSVEDNSKYLGGLKRFCNEPEIKSVIDSINPFENIKLQSNLYRYNTSFIQMLTDNMKPVQNNSDNGYSPIYGEMGYTPVASHPIQMKDWEPLKQKCMDSFVSLCQKRGIKLVFVLSPFASGDKCPCSNLISKYSLQHNIPFIDYYTAPQFVGHTEFFCDTSHLNDKGARVYSSLIGKLLSLKNERKLFTKSI